MRLRVAVVVCMSLGVCFSEANQEAASHEKEHERVAEVFQVVQGQTEHHQRYTRDRLLPLLLRHVALLGPGGL